MNFKADCIEISSNKIITCSENNRKMYFHNPSELEVMKIHVDGCQINDDSIRCDYLVIGNAIENYIELKGQDVNHAVGQLCNTIDKLSADKRKSTKRCFVISTRCPLSSTQIQVIKKKFKYEYNSSFIVKNIKHSEEI